ncbi:MgtC/SapB family protein [Kitasatospora sp. LaBMicrA B282]|uniref:MgtC/SapB family protein n=1 Tax=Kitasatospora sp. LaBMicrA B282 TaxID=3420949 RepID=UPI003D0B6424
MTHDLPLVEHLLAAFALTYSVGFERSLRGAAAGDRTFSLIGVGAAIVAALAQHDAPNALTGVITGVGFIGGGLTFREARANGDVVRGITTAATIFAAAAIGAAAGMGMLLLATTGTVLALLTLEIRHIPGLRLLDGRRWARPFAEDDDVFTGRSPECPDADRDERPPAAAAERTGERTAEPELAEAGSRS